ncbi:LysR family transcriptional regulator [Rhodoferax bucti]|uniref:LysR family transcriptional regulator n=1 Tax=Rhodoferax bucti TaxID=2576305 RepID=UPI001108DA79|nr:LysR family transcriptional regulator [Rhodoferax bucti]
MDRLLSMRVFQKVIDEGGFASAARALEMSPAVVTRLVADLEEHLGTRLLHRSTRKVSLSEAGEAYLARVRAILQDIDEADALANLHTQELAGELHLLSTPVLATYVLAPLLAGFRARYPKIVVHVQVESFDEPPVEAYDVTLFTADEAYDGTIVARKIASTRGILVATPQYLQRKGIPQHPNDLESHDCLELKGGIARHRRWHLRNEDHPEETLDLNLSPVLTSNHIETLISATLDGAGITPCTVELVAPFLATGELVRVLAPWVAGQLHLYAALPSRQYLPRRTRVFLDYLTEQTALMLAGANDVCGGLAR